MVLLMTRLLMAQHTVPLLRGYTADLHGEALHQLPVLSGQAGGDEHRPRRHERGQRRQRPHQGHHQGPHGVPCEAAGAHPRRPGHHGELVLSWRAWPVLGR